MCQNHSKSIRKSSFGRILFLKNGWNSIFVKIFARKNPVFTFWLDLELELGLWLDLPLDHIYPNFSTSDVEFSMSKTIFKSSMMFRLLLEKVLWSFWPFFRQKTDHFKKGTFCRKYCTVSPPLPLWPKRREKPEKAGTGAGKSRPALF